MCLSAVWLTARPLPGVMCAGKKLRRNFTAETIAKRSRAFEQYLCHLCSLTALQKALCVRHFFYLADLQAGQLLIRCVCTVTHSSVEYFINILYCIILYQVM